MCGGGTSSIKILDPFMNMQDFWTVISKYPTNRVGYEIKGDIKKYENIGIFYELTTGCDNKKCNFQCPARSEPIAIQIMPKILSKVTRTGLFPYEIPIYLYGKGNIDLYPFDKINMYALQAYSINVTPAIPENNFRILSKMASREHGRHILAIINTVDEAIWANAHDDFLYASILPVTLNSNYLEIFSKLKGNVIFKATDSLKSTYIGVEQFKKQLLDNFGIALPGIKEYKVDAGFKPVIQNIKENGTKLDITMRRCFHDLTEITLSIKGNDFIESNLSELIEFYNYQPNCHLCKGATWKGDFFVKQSYLGYKI